MHIRQRLFPKRVGRANCLPTSCLFVLLVGGDEQCFVVAYTFARICFLLGGRCGPYLLQLGSWVCPANSISIGSAVRRSSPNACTTHTCTQTHRSRHIRHAGKWSYIHVRTVCRRCGQNNYTWPHESWFRNSSKLAIIGSSVDKHSKNKHKHADEWTCFGKM